MTTTKKLKEINAAAISRLTDKVTGKVLGWLVPSDENAKLAQENKIFYQVKWNEACAQYECNCQDYGKHEHICGYKCKHIRAVCEVCKAQRDMGLIGQGCQHLVKVTKKEVVKEVLATTASQTQTAEPVKAEKPASRPVPSAKDRAEAPLHGRKGFSLLK
jgi:hypothetical protein